MSLNITKEAARLQKMTVRELRLTYARLFDEQTKAGNKSWLIKRILWRMQCKVEGDISERARKRALELANDADVRLSPPKVTAVEQAHAMATTTLPCITPDNRLPPPGTWIAREYKNRSLRVMVLENGFEFEGEVYKSLSAVAKAITGQHCNGFHFFRLRKEDNQ